MASFMYSTTDIQAIATTELYSHLEQQAQSVAPEIPSIVKARIQIERVGLTRNASSTPYIIYTIGDRRCSTFFKRKLLWQLMQALLKSEYEIEDKICGIIAKDRSGLSLWLGERVGGGIIPPPISRNKWQLVLNARACRFIERCNNRCQPQKETKNLAGYKLYARTGKDLAKNYQIVQKHRMQQTDELYAAFREAIASWDMSIIEAKLETHAQYKKAAWMQASAEEKRLLRWLAQNKVKVRDRVNWNYTDARLCYLEQWMPFEVISIVGGMAKLELIKPLVALEELEVLS